MKRVDLNKGEYYINRELSSLEFNRRVLEEANDDYHPLLERVKFLAICGSNLDEFFMSRVSDLRRQMARGVIKFTADGLPPANTIDKVRVMLGPILAGHAQCWREGICPDLKKNGIHVHKWSELHADQRMALRRYFEHEVYPALTPLAFDAHRPFPFISNLSINLAITVRSGSKQGFARVKVPTITFPRFIRIPEEAGETEYAAGKMTLNFVLLEELIAANLDLLFPGMEVLAAYPFRVTRDAEIEIQMEENDDMLTAVEEGVESRRLGPPVRLEVDSSMPDSVRDMLTQNMDLPRYLVYQHAAPLGLVDFWQLLSLDRPDLKDAPFSQYVPRDLSSSQDLFAALHAKDHLLFHPYDSFQPVVAMLQQAANDPEVLAIKITLYRIDKRSPVIESLIEARKQGKQVAAVVELKAKFDEENNISYSRTLEQEGVHVVYGPVDLKVHAKICMVVRKERRGIMRYCHLSSGNYNNVTTKVYGDLAYITTNPDIGTDVSNLFNALTGYANISSYQKLLVAPVGLRSGILDRIQREIERHREFGNGMIAWKLNGLLDKDVIKALYQASQEGVEVLLNVRGLCSLRPGVKGVSDNITVMSIVGRFLEHSRIYYFRNGGDEEVLLGSSDMMPRNLDKRVELLFPVQDAKIRSALVGDILATHLKDNVKARRLRSDGTYIKVRPKKGEAPLDSQKYFIEHRGEWHGD
ncbi:MAG TPA: polyphosphate kinase 1 [Methanomassiliicoccales archaeon]|nr:polyphosphate kinase 1 [Methanomassiliicoccales archaeon]